MKQSKFMPDLSQDDTLRQILNKLKDASFGTRIAACGSWASFANCFASYIFEKLSRDVVIICPHIDDADKSGEDLVSFSGKQPLTIPAWEAAPDLAAATDEIAAARLKSAIEITSADTPLLINTSIQAICRPMPT